jgi:hypothetical protein
MAEAEELALDTPVAPARVLPGQPLDQLTELLRDRRASRGVRVSPFLLDQASVPGEQGAGRHDPVRPKVPGQLPRQGGDTARSAQCGFGRVTWRRRTATTCRSTKVSMSFEAPLRASSASHPNNRIMSR